MPDNGEPTSSMISKRGLKTSKEFVDFCGALMDDLVTQRIDSETATAVCTAGHLMLKAVRMQREYSGANELDFVPQKKLTPPNPDSKQLPEGRQ